MKKSLCILAALLLCLVFSACCSHEYLPATCTEPETCSKCGETKGEALGHEWTEATCTEAKTCSRCGETEGEAPGHTWETATLGNPMTCSVCGAEGGTMILRPYRYTVGADGDDHATSYYVNGQRMMKWTMRADDYIDVCICSLDGSVISREFYYTRGYAISYMPGDENYAGFFVLLHINTQEDYDFFAIDWDNNQVCQAKLPAPAYGIALMPSQVSDDVVKLDPTDEAPYFLNMKTGEILSEYAVPEKETVELTGKGTWTVQARQEEFGLSLCSDAEETRWGYCDSDGRLLAEYSGATAFTPEGYALASEDGAHYDLIDTEFRVIGKNAAEGTDACQTGGTFRVNGEDGIVYYTVEFVSGDGCLHEFRTATCSEPETCVRCGETHGEPLEHFWHFATLKEPEKCLFCGETQGEKVLYTAYQFPTDDDYWYYSDGSRYAKVGGVGQDGVPCYELRIYDMDSTELSAKLWPIYGDIVACDYGFDGLCLLYFFPYDDSHEQWCVCCVDWDNELMFSTLIDAPENAVWYDARYHDENGIAFYCWDNPEDLWYVPFDGGDPVRECPGLTIETPDQGTWRVLEAVSTAGLRFCQCVEDSMYGYFDENDRLVAKYPKCSRFTPSGFALVSSDGRYFDLVDRDFHKLGTLMEAAGVNNPKNCFNVHVSDGTTISLLFE